jgi:flagellin
MSLSVLNNIPSLVAQNQLQVTNTNLQNTLFQLSSGSRINSGSDDPAGLSIVNGLQANISALTQSSQNATDGVGQLQVADGALSQVTTLLNRAVTLATEAANGGLTSDQFAAVTNEYNSITSEINRIGQATNFNGTSVFSAATEANPSQVVSTATSNLNVNDALTGGTTTTVQLGNNPAYTYTAGASADTLLASATGDTAATGIGTGQTISISNNGGTFNFTSNPLTYTGATATAVGTATAGGESMSVTNASGTTTYTAAAGASTIGAWLSGFNTAGASKGVSASLNATGNIVIQSNSGITAATENAAATTAFGALANNPLNYVGATSTTNTTAATSANETLTVVNAAGTTTFTNAGNATTIGGWINAFNTFSSGAGFGVTASLSASGYLQLTSTSAISSITQGAGNVTDFGTLAKAGDTVGDLMTQINTSGNGLTASLDSSGALQVTSSNGPITVSNNNMTATLGTVAATNTIQDLINGINSSGLGVTASLASVSNPNQLIGATGSLTGATAITAGETLTINSGTQAANGTYANTFTYTASASTKDTVAGTAGNNSVQGLIDAVNNSGTPFHAFLDGNGKLQITDSSYSGNLSASGTATAVTGALAQPAATTQLEITDPQNRSDLTVTNNDATLGFVAPTNGNPLEGGNADSFVAPQMSGSGGASVFISDGDVTNPLYNTITIQVGLLSSSQIGSNATTLQTQDLSTQSGAASALTVINNAISDVAAMRGTIGAGINRLNSATNVINTQIQNLTSAQSSMQDANVGQVVANLSKYQVLEQTGISALAQANQNEQAVLKLLQ